MPYYDFFLAPLSQTRRADYEAFVRETQARFLELGATEVVDCLADDVPDGKLTSFPLAVNLEPGETVATGFVAWPSKAARDAGWARMMAEDAPMALPFDGKRMIFGGFAELLRTTA